MRSAVAFALIAVLLAGCGVKRPLMRPNEIPAYEERQRQKHERLEQERRELEAKDRAAGILPAEPNSPLPEAH